MKSPVFLRDLKPELRACEEKRIRQTGSKEVRKALEEKEDICIGYYLKVSEYHPY